MPEDRSEEKLSGYDEKAEHVAVHTDEKRAV
jgi:hypothetical protein